MFPILGWEKLLYLHGRDLGECRALQGFRILLNHPKEVGGHEQALSSCPEEAGYGGSTGLLQPLCHPPCCERGGEQM